MRVLIAGSSGLIGSALTSALRSHGTDVARLVRREARNPDEFSWDPEGFGVPDEAFSGVDAVVSLGGVGIGDRHWSGHFRQELRDSRITPTLILAEAIAGADVPVFLSASATGFYGDTGERAATEADGRGTGFLADLAADWEEAAAPALSDTRVVFLRTGPVLAPKGGLLARVRPLVKTGLGGRLGDGEQFLSWISLRDEVAAIEFLLSDGGGSEITGPVNLTAPQPVRFSEFIRTYGEVLGRPTRLPVPAAVLRLIGGDMAKEMILASSRVVPDVLTNAGFDFADETIANALSWTR
ncbi:TIGR01777 family oxidoreductase [Gordonia crocea]|uniref:Epimerase n=1 Tax=Gordonia crocea TaxID=589162 RepID=A0A7I9UZI8_9ACTN|nr:TIGR01777 family oxidoreductase [Gordonia crocea]GED98588.1 epimerase [Gordonia crocea]